MRKEDYVQMRIDFLRDKKEKVSKIVAGEITVDDTETKLLLADLCNYINQDLINMEDVVDKL